MTLVRAYAAGGLAIAKRDLLVAASYRLRFVSQAVGILFSLTLFFYVSQLVRVPSFETPDAYFAFVVVGIVILQAINSTLTAPPGALHQELVAGTFERVVVSPLGPLAGTLGMMVFPFLYALATGLVTLALAAVAFGLPVAWGTAWLALPVAALATLAFAPLGMLLAALTLVAKQAAIGMNALVAVISLVAGLYFPVALLPDWAQWASNVQPFTPAVDLLRHVLVGTPLAQPAWLELARLAGFAVVLLPLALLALHAALRHSRRTATIIEF